MTCCTNGSFFKGVVTAIDADGFTLSEVQERWKLVREHTFVPIDLLRKGEVQPVTDGRFAYRWKDVKPGDTIEVHAKQDRLDERWYCLEISILRRPHATLPESQKPKDDRSFLWLRIANDIENGDDVNDDDIRKACPARAGRYDDGKVIPGHPGGLPQEYQKKLDAIRAKKKEKELKAPPPKKDDKK